MDTFEIDSFSCADEYYAQREGGAILRYTGMAEPDRATIVVSHRHTCRPLTLAPPTLSVSALVPHCLNGCWQVQRNRRTFHCTSGRLTLSTSRVTSSYRRHERQLPRLLPLFTWCALQVVQPNVVTGPVHLTASSCRGRCHPCRGVHGYTTRCSAPRAPSSTWVTGLTATTASLPQQTLNKQHTNLASTDE